uniref:Uncharacterized protein n=1 Tax=Meloidogyne enterolobii TaxID=390850 RepID=A0A6V7WQS2_MELEN|nr:unnamed protein product [Meloidogyne enterolobii]
MKFDNFFFSDTKPNIKNPYYTAIELKSEVFEFTLNDQLKNKWQAAIDRSIPLFLHKVEPDRTFVCISKCLQIFFKIVFKSHFLVDKKRKFFSLKLPNYPKNFEEMIIVRCWLERLFNCVYGELILTTIVFNPEMINILFDNDRTITFRVHCQTLFMFANNKIFENILKFVLNHSTISKHFSIRFYTFDFTQQNKNVLFNILTNEGNKIPSIHLYSYRLTGLYDRIMEYITTSKDCSRMIPYIMFYFSSSAFSRFEFSERAEKIEIIQLDNRKHTNSKFPIFSIKSEICTLY